MDKEIIFETLVDSASKSGIQCFLVDAIHSDNQKYFEIAARNVKDINLKLTNKNNEKHPALVLATQYNRAKMVEFLLDLPNIDVNRGVSG